MKRLNKGSALLVTLLIMVILTLTGISFLFMADTENKISNNYFIAIQALTAAKSGVYMVSSWFNYPPPETKTLLPLPSEIKFNARVGEGSNTIDDGTGNNATLYKWGGANADYPIFSKPYMGSNHTASVYQRFFGTEANPDIEISYDISDGRSNNFLNQLNTFLFGSAQGNVRIRTIKLYSPPLSPYPDEPWNVSNVPYGVCTALIEAERVRWDSSGNPVTLSTRRVKAIISDLNYSTYSVAYDVDGSIDINGDVMIHWGEMKATDYIDDNNINHLSKGAPWFTNERGTVSRCATLYGNPLDASGGHWQPLHGKIIEDPWYLIRSKSSVDFGNKGVNITAGTIPTQDNDSTLIPIPVDDKTKNTQNYTCSYRYNPDTNTNEIYSYLFKDRCQECTGNPSDPVCTGDTIFDTKGGCSGIKVDLTHPVHSWSGNVLDENYHIFGGDPTVAFALAFRGYTYWKNAIKTIMKQGGRGEIYYLVPGGYPEIGGICSSGKWGVPFDASSCKDFEAWTSGKEGFWFFDTNDAQLPRIDGQNITAEVEVKGQYWSAGFQYICAKIYNSSGGTKHVFNDLTFPGDPLWENTDYTFKSLRNGQYDESTTIDGVNVWVDRYINLRYPDTSGLNPHLSGPNAPTPFPVDETYILPGEDSVKWNKYGPTFSGEFYYAGIVYLTGAFRVVGSREFYGAVMVWNNDASNAGTVDVWYNPKLEEGLGLEKFIGNVTIEQIVTDM